MTTMSSAQSDTSPTTMRIAVEGCGHGTLDSIYASVRKTCVVNGWDGVDLVIIGGDFQAVRDRRDLNVTAMPVKYREMADFHQYYWGSRVAPYLTIFIGGNHEASNHLFELYHGGWVAPNIYYLGAANVVEVGPLKIAAMSGIWKGYDYRKPHYERLPYNSDDLYSIYHVREVDVRKLLAFRSQIDVGLSHDWPKDIVWCGDHKQLFAHRPYFKNDAESGKLGSTAAQKVMDRLRPPHWFSAHLHTKFTATKSYKKDQVTQPIQRAVPEAVQADTAGKRVAKHFQPPVIPRREQAQSGRRVSQRTQPQFTPHQEQLSAWGNFGVKARQEEAEETAKARREEQVRRDEAERTGVPLTANYTFEETYKKVKHDTGIDRDVELVSHSGELDARKENQHKIPQLDGTRDIPQLDGTCISTVLKRRRESSSDPVDDDLSNTQYQSIRSPHNGLAAVNPDAIAIDASDSDNETTHLVGDRENETAAINPDAIDIDTSDSDDEMTHLMSDHNMAEGSLSVHKSTPDKSQLQTEMDIDEPMASVIKNGDLQKPNDYDSPSHMAIQDGAATSGTPQLATEKNGEPESNIQPTESAVVQEPSNQHSTSNMVVPDHNNEQVEQDAAVETSDTSNRVSDEMRAKLATLSNKFEAPAYVSASLPHPKAITNEEVKFLALSKCQDRQNFLQLFEVAPYEAPTTLLVRPYKLSYNAEWLAIQRTFAPELKLGGNPNDSVAPHKGDSFYQARIEEEEHWVNEHIVKPGLLTIPENFTRDIFDYENASNAIDKDMPREVTNSQTAAYCKLLDIPNPFDISEEERDARIAAGPAESTNPRKADDHFGKRGGRGQGGSRGGRGGRGGRGRGSGSGNWRGGRGSGSGHGSASGSGSGPK